MGSYSSFAAVKINITTTATTTAVSTQATTFSPNFFTGQR